jgi:methionine-S-sulfoxide reductase
VQVATFGMGCFWKPSEELLKINGVLNTVVGYTGNPSCQEKSPTYDDVCFGRYWVEAVRVSFDDEVISYSKLLDACFEKQEPTVGYRQYASIIFPENMEQQRAAEKWLEENKNLVRRDGLPASITKIEARTSFYKAEEYHQKYWQKTRSKILIMLALLAISSGILDDITPLAAQSTIRIVANFFVLFGLVYQFINRTFDKTTVEIK